MDLRRRSVFEGSSSTLTLDSRHLPVLLVRWTGAPEVELVAPFGTWLAQLLLVLEATGEHAVLVVDLTGADRPSSAFRRALSQMRQEQRARIDRWILHDLIVTDKVVIRGVVSALQWVTPWVRMTSVSNMHAAIECCRKELRRAGIELGPLSAEDFRP